jgi:hypothetical protein
MHQWLNEPGLAGVRDTPALTQLPAEERRRWQAFWADVAAVRTKGRKAQQPSTNQPPRRPEK